LFKSRVIVALLSTFIFSLILAYIDYTPVSERLPDTSYGSFISPIPFLIIITVVPYFLGGIPVSILIDKYVDKLIVKLPLYLMGGYIVGVITLVISFGTFAIEMLWFGIYGVAGSLIFFIIMSLNARLKNLN
jgi:MFS family permease